MSSWHEHADEPLRVLHLRLVRGHHQPCAHPGLVQVSEKVVTYAALFVFIFAVAYFVRFLLEMAEAYAR